MATIASISAQIRDDIGDFLLTSQCCATCSKEELIEYLFNNDIDTVLNLDIVTDVLTTDEINQLAAFADAANPENLILTGNGAMAGVYPLLVYSTPSFSSGAFSVTYGDVNCCIINQITTFLIHTKCCRICSQEELTKMLFFNDIDTVLSYEIVDDVLNTAEKNLLISFTGCLYCPVAMPSTSTGVFAGGQINHGCCGDGSSSTGYITESYDYIAYNQYLKRYTYDITSADFSDELDVVILIDGMYNHVGNPDSASQLIADLNALQRGTFTLDGGTITVLGYHEYGQMFGIVLLAASTLAAIQINTGQTYEQEDAYGYTGVDLSNAGVVATDADKISFYSSLSPKLCTWIGGAADKYKHEVSSGASQYNFIPAEITALGQNPATLQDGVALTNPGFGYSDDFVNTMYRMNVRNMMYVMNIVPPLIPYIGGAINYAALDFTDCVNEYQLFKTACEAKGIAVPKIQMCLETVVGNFQTIFSEGGVTYGKMVNMIVPLVDAIDNTVKIYLDDYNYYDNNGPWYPDWMEDTLAQLSVSVRARITGIRQYQNYDDDHQSLATALPYGDTLDDMISYVRGYDSDFKVNFQQLAIKASNDLRNTIGQGVVTINSFLNVLQAQIDYDNVFDVFNFQSLRSVSNQYPTVNPVYHYMTRFAPLCDGELVPTSYVALSGLKSMGCIKNGVLTVGVLNRGETDIPYYGLLVDGVYRRDFLVDGVYGDDEYDSTARFTTDKFVFKKFTFTKLTLTLN